jgi:hypothetical protein
LLEVVAERVLELSAILQAGQVALVEEVVAALYQEALEQEVQD